MPRWLSRLVLAVITLCATLCASGVVLAAASADSRVTELLVTCLSCGEQWLFTPTATLGAGLLSLFRRRKSVDKCPKCGSRAVKFGHVDETRRTRQGRIS
jgi:Zn finger protein HypA/HybF involved in hydrogenase expression